MAQQTNDSNVRKEITLGGMVYILEGTVDFKITPKGPIEPTTPPGPEVPPVTTKPDSFGTIKEGKKWSKNPGPSTGWGIKNMDNPSTKFKIVAPDGLNIIADLDSEKEANALIEYFKTNVFPPKGNDDSVPVDPDGPLEPSTGTPTTVGGADYPYESTGNTVPMTQRGVTQRNYASGKPSDWTIEKNAKGIPFKNIQAAFTIKVPEVWEHNDNLSIKGLGQHMGSGWYDNGISIYEGQSCLGKEEDHPSTQLCVVKGKKYGDLRGKTVQVASTFFVDTFKTEFWVNIPGVTQGWDKAVEGTAPGGFKPNLKAGDKTEVQLRIDGFKEKDQPPEIVKFGVSEIKV